MTPARLALLALLWFTGVYLRVPVLVAPALAPQIGGELGLGAAGVGALTTLPVLMLGLGALPGAWLIGRLGARRALVMAVALMALASAARGLAPPAALLFAATAVMGFGIAVMQPALPAIVARWCPGFTALAVAVYMNGMLLGEFLGAGLTLPLIMPLTGNDWRLTLLVWSLPALIIAGLLTRPDDRAPDVEPPTPGSILGGDPRMWSFGLILGAASTLFFGTNAYMADLLAARGEADRLATTLFWFNLSQGAASLVMVPLAPRLVARRGPVLTTGLMAVTGGLAFLWLDGNSALVAAVLLGSATAIQLILMVAAAPHVVPPGDTGTFSAGMFAVGYGMAFAVPLAGGLLAELSQRPQLPIWPMLAYGLLVLPLIARMDFRRRVA
ncbi:CynX/NimT family MFS transporter [Spectribacter hydrogenooxidans]|uniref:MFS transporter n=1 Tax=Spectribacter hydrogenoxidans TaxID=3075608 RepID=A0ABU3C1Z2_9GAMM|nr:MFS transporter [Salinisphaera sp. W335]MDT0635567.1 MFS transporter [Salinisphaera sp. W335]